MSTNPIVKRQILPNGMACFVIPKKGYEEKQAAITVRYGGADYRHIMPDGTHVEMPTGIAHFLEHKLFEDPELSMFDVFTRQGASVNAYTHFTHTVYYFNTIDSFDKNLETLFRLIQTPHFTDENVEKEKGIILSEIDMYADNPYWQVYTGLHQALFQVSPLKQEILGSQKSVQSIQKEQLYDCYNHFYTPDNMALICVGDFESAQIIELAQKLTEKDSSSKEKPPHTFHGNEPAQVAKPFTKKSMSVSIPLFQMGFKALYPETASPTTMAASSILADMVAGESSEIYSDLYNLGMIDNQFSVEYIGGTYYGIFLLAGTSSQPKEIRNRILKTIDAIKRNGLDSKRFEIIKNKHIGRYIRSLNSIETLSSLQADLFTKDQDISDAMDAFQNVTLKDVESQLNAHLQEKNCAISIINP